MKDRLSSILISRNFVKNISYIIVVTICIIGICKASNLNLDRVVNRFLDTQIGKSQMQSEKSRMQHEETLEKIRKLQVQVQINKQEIMTIYGNIDNLYDEVSKLKAADLRYHGRQDIITKENASRVNPANK